MCGSAGVLFCDGFEGSLSSGWVVTTSPSGTLTPDATQVFRGADSLKVHVDGVTSSTYVNVELRKDTAPLPQNPIYVRLFIYVPSSTPAMPFWILNYQQETDMYGGSAVQIESNRDLTVGTYRLLTSPQTTSNYAMPTDTWVCLEYQLQTRTDTTSTSFLTLVGGGGTISPGPVQITSGEPLMQLYVGFEAQMPANQGAFDLWIDEVYVDNKPIGCTK
jgi:hypothetical protein